MHEDGKKLLNLMFRPGETVCVSHNKFGYHSIPLENAIGEIATLVPTVDSLIKRKLSLEEGIEQIPTDNLLLCALNPIKGYREDLNCTAFRSFLVELDYGPIPEQLAYIHKLEIPYSATIFSGGKSVHSLITLDKDLPSELTYRTLSEWILNIASIADQNTKNPSRSIRIPGAFREPGKQQKFIHFNGLVKIETLVSWLKKYPNCKPKEREKKERSTIANFDNIAGWVCKKLIDGIYPPNRNKQWFCVAIEFSKAGYGEDDIVSILEPYFNSEKDFNTKEWLTTIKSGIKYAESGR